jgi:hypothetical protein
MVYFIKTKAMREQTTPGKLIADALTPFMKKEK